MQRAELTTSAPSAPSLSMNAIWRTIRGYILWQYERGTLHYDIMVTLILIFVLFSPYWIDFNDKPTARNPHPTDVVVTRDADGTEIVSGLEKGVTAFKVMKRDGQWTTDNVWDNQDVSLYMTNGVIVRDMLVGMSHRNSGQFFALDAKTGKTLWTSAPRQATNAAIVRAGDVVFLLKDDAELIVAKPSASGLDPVKRYTVADSATWAAPTVAGNRMFVKDTSALALWTW